MAKHTIEIDLTTEQEDSLALFLQGQTNADGNPFADVDEWLTEANTTLLEGVFQRFPTPAIQTELDKKRAAEGEAKRLSRPTVNSQNTRV